MASSPTDVLVSSFARRDTRGRVVCVVRARDRSGKGSRARTRGRTRARSTRGRVVRVVVATDGPLSWCSLGVLTRARACWRVVRSRRALQHARECTCRCSRARTRFGRRASRGPDVASGARLNAVSPPATRRLACVVDGTMTRDARASSAWVRTSGGDQSCARVDRRAHGVTNAVRARRRLVAFSLGERSRKNSSLDERAHASANIRMSDRCVSCVYV